MNRGKDWRRKNTKEWQGLQKYSGEILDLATPAATDKIEKRQEIEKLASALATLPSDTREMVLLRYKHEVSIKDLSEIFSLSQSGIKMRIHRALQTLHESLKKSVNPMENQEFSKIIEDINQLPELDPPEDMLPQVMQRIKKPRRNGFTALFALLITPRPVQLRPITAFGLCCALIFCFYALPDYKSPTRMPVEKPIKDLAVSVEDAHASFLIGRGFMEAGREHEALPLLQKASLTQPENPYFAYWEGLCFWANGMKQEERASYLRGIEAAPDVLPLQLNLAHNYLEENDFHSALGHYEKVLALAPGNRTALYNRALTLHLLKNQGPERKAWLTYLDQYRFGSQAFRAVQYLNLLGDFTYRTYNLGKRKAIVNHRALLGLGSRQSYVQNADILVHALRHDLDLSLHIIGFNENNVQIAKRRVRALKRYLIKEIGENQSDRIALSWFGEREQTMAPARNTNQAESLLIFARPNNQANMETKI